MTLPSSTMRDRRPAQLVIEKLLLEQSAYHPRSTFSRFFGVSPLAPDSVSWYLGARGEIEVGRILAQLPSEWSTFHAIPVGTKSADIDHFVIGPGGIFAINTKHHNGKAIWVAGQNFMVAGQKKSYIYNSESEATRVAKSLSQWVPQLPPVETLIVLVNPKSITIREKPERVRVMDAKGLRRWLTKRPQILGLAELAALTSVIDDPAMWRIEEPVAASDSTTFEQLDHEVRSARVRRALWLLALIAVLIVGGIAVYPSFMSFAMHGVTGR